MRYNAPHAGATRVRGGPGADGKRVAATVFLWRSRVSPAPAGKGWLSRISGGGPPVPGDPPATTPEATLAGLLRHLPFSWALGLSLFRGRGRLRVSAATVVSVLGIGLGVATLTAVLAVTGGFEEAFRDRILGVYPHVVVMSRGSTFTDYADVAARLAAVPGVVGANPSTYDEMMITSDEGSSGAIVKGVDLDGVDRVSSLRSLTRGGTLEPLRHRPRRPMGVLLGCELMSKLGVQPGGRVSLTTPLRGVEGGGTGPFGMAPTQQAFVVVDCFESGFYEYDARLVILDLAAAQEFLGRGPEVRWIELRLDDLFDTEAIRPALLAALSPYTWKDFARDAVAVRDRIDRVLADAFGDRGAQSVQDLEVAVLRARQELEYGDLGAGPPQRFRLIDWKEMNRNLFGALRMQKVVLALFFLIIVLVAAFNIVGTQLIVARERVKEVSTLVALGASRRKLMAVFVAHGFVLGLLGVVVGLGLGRLVVSGIRALDFGLDPKVYLITELPAVLHWGDALTIAGLSAVVVLLSCLLSSWRATRLNPVDGLRKVA